MKVAMIGVGKLGKVAGEVMNEHYEVSGYDINPRTDTSFPMKDTFKEAIDGADIIFVAAATPHKEEFEGAKVCSDLTPIDFDYSSIESIFANIEKYSEPEQVVVLISTVTPGTIRELFGHIKNDIVYNPYLIAQGSIEHDMKNAEMLILGTKERDSAVGKYVKHFYDPIIVNKDIYYAHGTWEEMESVKVFYNTFINIKLTFANTVMDMVDKMPNANADVVTESLANCNYRLMSSNYFKSGMVHGGVCLPRDNVALASLSNKLDMNYNLFGELTSVREAQAFNMAERVKATGLPAIIVGRSYKPGVPIDNGSSSLLVGEFLDNPEYHDPLMGFEATPKKAVYLLAHYMPGKDNTYGLTFPEGSVIIDPWREKESIPGCSIIRVGDYE